MGTIWDIDPSIAGTGRETEGVSDEKVISGMRRLGADTTALVIHPEHRSTESSVDCVRLRQHHQSEDGPNEFYS